MKSGRPVLWLTAVAVLLAVGLSLGGGDAMVETLRLPQPKTEGKMSVEEAISKRRSRRAFSSKPLTLEQLGQILWCAQGITDSRGVKWAAPSAGATYPLDVYVAVGEGTVAGLKEGVYRYVPSGHALLQTGRRDIRAQVASAALDQEFLAEAPADILIAADYTRTTARYGDRGVRYVHMEVGHVGQDVYLQAEALGLGTVAVGAFRDEQVARHFGLPAGQVALYLMPIGYAR